MESFSTFKNNVSWKVSNGLLAGGIAATFDTIQSKLANGFRDEKVKFYWDYGNGGAIYNIIARKLVGGAVEELGEVAMSEYKKLIGGDKIDRKRIAAEQQNKLLLEAQNEEESKYGCIKVNDGKNSVQAFDDWGYVCYDALMLSIPVSNPINISVRKIGARSEEILENIQSDHLVWYDTTALVNLSSDKDLILTRVTGRDYSRKELISNGDLNFSVSGHITSNMPDIYPSAEVQKFRQIMQYKGIVEINNEFLDQWGVKKIVIKSFNLPSNEGNKAIQDYSFEAVGIQPDVEANVTEDTISIIDYTIKEESEKKESLTWENILDQYFDTIKSNSLSLASQGTALADGFLNNMAAKIP